jgi:glucosamine--fructose-6-phosphate aminotransferase (isomerizing)
MCGIVAYVGEKEAYPILLKGLKRLEYRGYDSAGVALIDEKLNIQKKQGKVADLEEFCQTKSMAGSIGIGHTRWATHGVPSDRNAHPHLSSDGKMAMIHNGIIENYDILKKELLEQGYTFNSETDSEVLLKFIEEIKKKNNCDLKKAISIALKRVIGAYVIVIVSEEYPDTLFAARKGSPLVIGVSKNAHYLASDATPIIEYTNEVVYVNDYEIAIIKKDEMILTNLKDEEITPYIQKLDLKLEAIEKGGYDHFMLKEINEQPNSVYDCMRGRVSKDPYDVILGGIHKYEKELLNANRIVIVACGTSWHAGLVAEYLIEDLCRIPVEVEYASEFRYRNPVIQTGDVVIAISQSGETADTLVAIEMAKQQGAIIFGVCNAVGSSIPRTTHEGVYTHAGPEIGVASTKAFTAQLTVMTMIAMKVGLKKGTLSKERFNQLVEEMLLIPEKIKKCLKLNDSILEISKKYKDSTSCLYLGRGYNFPVALEGALKLKEISYIHAEGYPAAEMKHGPIALIEPSLPSVFIATKDKHYEKVVSNIQEVKARSGKVIAVLTEGDNHVAKMCDDVIFVPETDEVLAPLINVIPLQILSYHMGVLKGYNVDQPRNLAKSVTVE